MRIGPARRLLRDVIALDEGLATKLTRQDRVHTYAGFFIGDIHL
ncbi:MAG: hypothetical protein U1F34_06565 [Gammaproteobacteria bacterium]